MLKCNCLNLLILRLILDSYYDDDIIINNNNNKNEGIINLSFQYNTQTSNTESYVTYIHLAELSHSVVLHENFFWWSTVVLAW